MVSRARVPSVARAAQPAPWVGEGRGQLCRVEGYSPALGSPLTVYAVLPRPAAGPSALERLATVLSGDGGFVAHAVAVEELPFSASGYAVVDPAAGRVLANAVREEAAARLEEHRVRRPVLLLLTYGFEESVPLEALLELRRLGFGLEVRPLRSPLAWKRRFGYAVELRAPRPLAAEERARARRLIRERYRNLFPLRPMEEEALARAGLLALAEIAPSAYWARGGLPQPSARFEGGAVEEGSGVTVRLAPLSDPLWLPRVYDAEGPRGRVYYAFGGVYAAVRAVDDRFLELAEGARRAVSRLAERYLDWRDLLGALREAEFRVAPFLSLRAPIANGAGPYERVPRAKVWEEGGRVKVWLHPELKRWLEEELAEVQWPTLRFLFPEIKPFEGLRGYLRRVSEELGREVELVGEEPPFRLSPEVDAAAEELRRALRELVGSA